MDVLLLTVNDFAATVPNVTADAAEKLEPVMTTEVPPVNGPADGLTDDIAGISLYVNQSPVVSRLIPPGVVTLTLTIPALPAGEVQYSFVPLETATFVAETPPKVTVAPATKPVPVTVTVTPPAVGPALGETEDTVGTGRYV
jgi:hypothetical protein